MYSDFSDAQRRHWGFAFSHASTSSKCILFSIRTLVQFICFVERPWNAKWIVSEMIDWLKVRDPAFNHLRNNCNPDNWEEPNSRSSTTGWADCLDGRCKQENWKGDSDPEADGNGKWWTWRAATICRVGKRDPKVPNYVIWIWLLGGGQVGLMNENYICTMCQQVSMVALHVSSFTQSFCGLVFQVPGSFFDM